jgi:hypothetical protein
MPTRVGRIFLGRKDRLKPIARETDDGTIAFLNSVNTSGKQVSKELGRKAVGSCADQFFAAINIHHEGNAIQIALLVDGASIYHALFLSSPNEPFASGVTILPVSLKK